MTNDNSVLPNSLETNESQKKAKRAAAFACGQDHLRSGQRIGVGSGTTASFLVEYIKEKYNSGELTDIRCVPTSFLVFLIFVDKIV